MQNDAKVALITGANRGLGFETCRKLAKKGYRVILTARDNAKGAAAAERLSREGLKVEFQQLDVNDASDIWRMRDSIEKKYRRLDVLVNNAGILLDSSAGGNAESAFTADIETLRKSLETNTFGTFRMCQALIPLMLKQGHGRVVNLSSGMGQLSEMNGGYPGYRISKTAVNAVTRIFADETKGTDVLVNSVCPGWVKTDMGGPDAELSIEEGVDTIVWLATLPSGGSSGGFFRERKPIPW